MANSEFVEILSPKAKIELEQANAELVKMLANMKNVNAVTIGAKTPSGSDSALKSLTAEYDKQTKVIQQLQKQLEQLANAKKQNNVRTSEEIVNQRALAQSADRQTRATSALVGAYANLNARHQQAKKTLQDLIASQSASTSQIKKAQREYDVLDRRIMAADRSVRVFNRNVGNYPRQAVAGIRSLMSAFGLFGGVYLFASAIKNAFKVTKEFDKASADLAATLGKNRKEITALTNSAKQFGATTIFTAKQVTELQKELGKLGFSEREILASTDGILSLASAVDTDLATAAEVGGSTLRAFNLDASEMNRVVDVMAKGFTSSALDISNFRESIKYVAPIAAASNITIEQTTALLGALADNGIKGSQAGTSLRRIMTDIVRTGKPFNEGLREIVKNGISVKDAFDEVGRTAQTSLVVLGNNIEKIDALTVSLDNAGGSAQKMADEQLDSLNGKILLLTSAWDGFILSLNKGEGTLSGVLRGAIDIMTDFVKAWEYAFAGRLQRNEIVINEVTSKKTNEFENKLLKEKNILLKEEALIKSKINLLEKILQKDPSNQNAITEINNLRERGKEVQKQLENESRIIKERAQMYNEAFRNDANNSMEEALKLEKRISELKDIISAPGTIDAKRKANFELEKTRLKLTEINNQTKYYNSLIIATSKHMEKTAGKKTEEIKDETTEIKNNTTEIKNNTKAKKEEADLIDGSVDWLKKEIQLLEKKQSQLSTTNEEYEKYNAEIKTLTGSLDILTGKYKQLDEAMKEVGVNISDFDLSDSGVDKWYDEMAQSFQQPLGDGDTWQDQFNQWATVGVDAIQTVQQAQNAYFENQLSNLERERDIALLFAGQSADAKAEIDRQYDEKRRKILERQAKQDKAYAIVNSIINTATAVVRALPNIPLSVAIGLIGTAQTALIASQQIPQFYKGTENAPEGYAWTQERGAEVILDKSGNIKSFGSSNGAELTYLNQGDKVLDANKSLIFNKELNGILNNNGITSVTQSNQIDLSPLNKRLDNLASVIKNKSEWQYISDRQGERVFRKEQGIKALIVSNRLRVKG